MLNDVNTKSSHFLAFLIKPLTDLCLTLPCGVNANCETNDNSFECSCPSGLTGDPKTKCEGNPGLEGKDIVIYFLIQIISPNRVNKSVFVSDFKVQCFITSASECYFEAKNKKLGIGGQGQSFEIEDSAKGCYAYGSSSTKNGLAFFGSKGSVKTMALTPLEQNSEYTGTYPLYKPCLKAGENRCFLFKFFNK